MTDNEPNIVPFGKYRGEPIATMLADCRIDDGGPVEAPASPAGMEHMQENELWSIVHRLAEQIQCSTIVDVGAYDGAISARSLEKLCSNLANMPRAHPSAIALSCEAGKASLHLGAKGYTSSLYPREERCRRYYHRDFTMVDTVPIKTDTLDNLFRDARIDILKLDKQGAELDILMGTNDLLRRGAISIIVTEFFFVPHYADVPLLDAIWSHLRRFGYELYDLFKGPYANNGQIRYGDAIFVSSEFRRDVIDAAPEEA